MARTWTRRALLGSGLVVLTGVGGAGGYGVGIYLDNDATTVSDAADPVALPKGSRASAPAKRVVPDTTKALSADSLNYKTREFVVTEAVKSAVRVRVPSNWSYTLPEPKVGRFTDPTGRRYIRIGAGFALDRSPEQRMATKMSDLNSVPADQMLTIKSSDVDPQTKSATLVYTFVPENVVRHVIVRWVANGNGDCMFELAVTGLPQDRVALEAILKQAEESAYREDSDL